MGGRIKYKVSADPAPDPSRLSRVPLALLAPTPPVLAPTPGVLARIPGVLAPTLLGIPVASVTAMPAATKPPAATAPRLMRAAAAGSVLGQDGDPILAVLRHVEPEGPHAPGGTPRVRYLYPGLDEHGA